MKRIIIIAIFILTAWWANAQEGGKVVATIMGKVVDETTNEPVSYTNIGLEGTFYGTASNAEGNFELKIPEELATKNIFFSAVGFQNKTFPVTELFGKEFTVVKLQSQSYDIGDINVAAQSRVLIRILRMAAENTPYNFIGGPLNLVGTYENSKTIDDTIKMNQNAAVVIFDKTGYSKPSKADAFLSVKYSLDRENETPAGYRFSTGTNNLDELLELDWVRSGSSVLNPALSPYFKLTLEEEPVIDGVEHWVIAFKQTVPTLAGSGDFHATLFEGKITIAKDDYSVKKIEGTIRSDKNSLQGRSVAVGNSSIKTRENVSYDFMVTYSNLKPDVILLNKKYESEGKKVSEQSGLKIKRVQTTGLTTLETRDYFPEK
jgi:hypothetical protein